MATSCMYGVFKARGRKLGASKNRARPVKFHVKNGRSTAWEHADQRKLEPVNSDHKPLRVCPARQPDAIPSKPQPRDTGTRTVSSVHDQPHYLCEAYMALTPAQRKRVREAYKASK